MRSGPSALGTRDAPPPPPAATKEEDEEEEEEEPEAAAAWGLAFPSRPAPLDAARAFDAAPSRLSGPTRKEGTRYGDGWGPPRVARDGEREDGGGGGWVGGGSGVAAAAAGPLRAADARASEGADQVAWRAGFFHLLPPRIGLTTATSICSAISAAMASSASTARSAMERRRAREGRDGGKGVGLEAEEEEEDVPMPGDRPRLTGPPALAWGSGGMEESNRRVGGGTEKGWGGWEGTSPRRESPRERSRTSLRLTGPAWLRNTCYKAPGERGCVGAAWIAR
jgi:hypothetical protein